MVQSRERLVALAFIVETALAGANGVAIRFSNRELAPVWGAGLRFALASVLLVFVLLLLGQALPRGKALLVAIVFGLFQFAGAFGLFYFALTQIHAGLGQTLLALVPLATLLLAVVQRQERLSLTAVLGTFCGVSGIALLSFDPQRGPIPLLALAAVVLSVVCFGQALVLVRRLPRIHPVSLNAVGMVSGALVLLGVSALSGEPWVFPERVETWTALAYVVLIGSVVVFLLHVFIAQHWTASRAAYVMVVIPLVTIGLSAWLDQEPVTGSLLLGGGLVIVGVYVGALRREPNSDNPVEDPRAA